MEWYLRDQKFKIQANAIGKALTAARLALCGLKDYEIHALQCIGMWENMSNAATFDEMMRAWEWQPTYQDSNEDGDVIRIGFSGETHYDHYDQVLFWHIAPYVQSGSYLEIENEDGTVWRYVFKNGRLYIIEPEMVWPKVTPDNEIKKGN